MNEVINNVMKKAIIVGVDYKLSVPFEYSLEELKNLSLACNIEVIHTLTQNLDRPTPNFYVGTGKIDELRDVVEALDADLVIFNTELSPSHIRNIEAHVDIKVIDRTILILDIFASRAKTKEAMIQVEVAQLKYMLPRLTGLTSSLSRQTGGIGARGPGEKKLELNRRKIEGDILKLERELKEIVQVRKSQRRKRNKSGIPKVSLVGYTNAGKSSFMNTLLKQNELTKSVFEKDMLFATLETSSRQLSLNNKKFVLTDTVGFVSDLPHHLVNSFKSTLEEVTESDLLIHVVDSSNDNLNDQINVTNDVIKSLGADEIPMIYAFNKIDMNPNFNHAYDEEAYYISCKTNQNFDTILKVIEEKIFDCKRIKILLPFDKGNLFSSLKETANIISFEYENDGILVDLEVNEIEMFQVKDYIIE